MSSNLGEHAKRALEGQALCDFQSAMESFCRGAESVAKLLLELCALGLGLPPETFCKITRDHSHSCLNFLRLNHYPVCPTHDLTLGLGAHTDFYVLTLLHQCQVGGLQVGRDGIQWITVKPRHGAYVVNVRDMLQAWTNGRFKSAQHRVVLNDKILRNSVAFFLTPASFDTVISAPHEIVQADGKREYKSFTYGEYLEFVNTHACKEGKTTVQWLPSFAQ